MFHLSGFGQQVGWTWMGGESTSQNINYGEKGVGNAANNPGNVSTAYSWTDDDGKFWMLGSGPQFSGDENHSVNVFWRLDGTEWTWVAGDKEGKISVQKGDKGSPSGKNNPGWVIGATHVYHNGMLYFFGGSNQNDLSEYSNDLWAWDGKAWIWLWGNDEELYNPGGNFGVKGVPSAQNLPPARVDATMWADNDGNIWLYGGYGQIGGWWGDLWKWDGKMWTWMSGSDETFSPVIYRSKGTPHPEGQPGARVGAKGWTDDSGKLFLFGGATVGTSQANPFTPKNDIWCWDGEFWTWVKGDSIDAPPGHYGQKLLTSSKDVPSGRSIFHLWKDAYNRVWVYGGGGTQGAFLNDLWVWDGVDWTWINGAATAMEAPIYGQKGVADPLNNPGGRSRGLTWTGTNGDFWLYGGLSSSDTRDGHKSDLWRLSEAKEAKVIVMGNGVVIQEQDNTPEPVDFTHFGRASITNIPIKRTYYIRNIGSASMDLWEEPVVLTGAIQHFKVVRQPSSLRLDPGDSVSFTIAFDPTIEGKHNVVVNINSKDRTEPYLYTITGQGTPPNINLIDAITCSSVRLFIKPRNVDHYTVLVSDSGKTEFPVDDGNYNYSPYYLRAPVVKEHARIIYQGALNTLDIEELVAGRSYQVVVVPGNGLAGNTTYFRDSSSILYFKTLPSKWQDSLVISPSQDSAICETDTLIFKGSSPFALQWNDGPLVEERTLLRSAEYYFLSKDTEECWISSDSVLLENYPLPEIDSVYVSTPKPWCEGDTLEITAVSSHEVLWSEGSVGSTLRIHKSDEYSMRSESIPGCSTTASLVVRFNALPNAYFVDKKYESYGGDVELTYVSDNADIQWIYNGDTLDNELDIKIDSDGEIRLYATSSEGCSSIDTAEVIRREVVLRAIPNAFSPNNDGLNDSWFFLHENSSGMLTVFNRWGGIIYQGPPTWDGKIFEESVPSGTYFFQYQTDDDGKEEVLSGKVNVIR